MCFTQDLLAGSGLLLVWHLGLRRAGRAGTIALVILAQAILLLQVVDAGVLVRHALLASPFALRWLPES